MARVKMKGSYLTLKAVDLASEFVKAWNTCWARRSKPWLVANDVERQVRLQLAKQIDPSYKGDGGWCGLQIMGLKNKTLLEDVREWLQRRVSFCGLRADHPTGNTHWKANGIRYRPRSVDLTPEEKAASVITQEERRRRKRIVHYRDNGVYACMPKRQVPSDHLHYGRRGGRMKVIRATDDPRSITCKACLRCRPDMAVAQKLMAGSVQQKEDS